MEGECNSLENKCYRYLLALDTFHLLFPPWKQVVIPRQFEPLCFRPNSSNGLDFRACANRQVAEGGCSWSDSLPHNMPTPFSACKAFREILWWHKSVPKHTQRELPLECHILSVSLSSWSNQTLLFLPIFTGCFPKPRIINVQYIQHRNYHRCTSHDTEGTLSSRWAATWSRQMEMKGRREKNQLSEWFH